MPRMPRSLAPTATLATVLLAALLTGCTPDTPVVTAPPTPDTVPVFTSEEEALAAAQEAYGAYIEAVSDILADGGSAPERLEKLVSTEIYEKEKEGFALFSEQRQRGVGERTFTMKLQQYDTKEVSVYACDDISKTDVLDADGKSVVATSRAPKYAFEVTFDIKDGVLVMASKELWSGDGVC